MVLVPVPGRIGVISPAPISPLVAAVALLALQPHLAQRHTAAAGTVCAASPGCAAMHHLSVGGMCVVAVCSLSPAQAAAPPTEAPPHRRGETTTSAVIVSTSLFWHNYRHAANALSVYRTVKRLGVRDDNIVLMLAGEPLPEVMWV